MQGGPLRQPTPGKQINDQTKLGPLDDDNPIQDWVHPKTALMLILSGDKLFISPAQRYVLVPSADPAADAAKAPAHFATDFGSLFSVPASGASGTRVFQAGKRSALLIDAGSDPSMGVRVEPVLPTPATGQAAIYTAEFTSLMSDLGLSTVSRVMVIHGHLDHVGGVPAVVENWGTRAENVVIPKQYQNLAAVRKAVETLKSTTSPGLVSRGFGTAWNPEYRLKDKAPQTGNILRTEFTIGELRVESVGLRPELRAVQTQPARADIASLMTRVTRTTDRARVVILGDLRGQDLEVIKTAMEAQTPGSWEAFFSGVTTLSGFSHHVGRLEAGDIRGIMSLLDATLLKTGNLDIVEQTNPTARGQGQSRVETLDLLSNLGAKVSYTTLPTAGQAPSSVTATRDTVTATGPNAVVNPVVQSNLTTGLARVKRLNEIKETIEQWRPWLEEINKPDAVNRIVQEIDQSTATLRQSLRAAAEAAVTVRTVARTSGTPAPAGAPAPGAAESSRYEAAVAAIPEKTPFEETLTPEALKSIDELRNKPAEEIPVMVAVHQARTKGIYSDKAFTYYLGQLDATTRGELFSGRRGGLVPRQKAFERVRFEVEFRRRVLGGETWSLSGFRPGGMRTAAYGVNLLMLAVELWNDIGQPLLEAHRNSQKIKEATQVVPFLRRIMFWQTMGARVHYTGVDDPTFGSPSYEADPDNARIPSLDALFIQSPGLSDADILLVAAFLTYNVRNFDEFASIFIDTKQDAVQWDNGTGTWENSTWKIRTGYYETSGSNHVEEKWEDSPKLTQFMRKLIPVIIANTQTLVGQFGKPTPPEMAQTTGYISTRGTPKYRAKLAKPADSTEVTVQVENRGTSAPALIQTVKWWSPPVFYVLDDSGTTSLVTGADYNTYARLRGQETESHDLGMDASGTHDYMKQIGNVDASVIIKSSLLERIPEAGAQGPAAQPQPAPAAPATTGPAPAPTQPAPGIFGPLPSAPKDSTGPKTPSIGPQIFDKPGADPSKKGDDRPTILPGVGGRF